MYSIAPIKLYLRLMCVSYVLFRLRLCPVLCMLIHWRLSNLSSRSGSVCVLAWSITLAIPLAVEFYFVSWSIASWSSHSGITFRGCRWWNYNWWLQYVPPSHPACKRTRSILSQGFWVGLRLGELDWPLLTTNIKHDSLQPWFNIH